MKKLIYTLSFLLFTNILYSQWQPDVRLTNADTTSNTSYNNAWCIASSGDSVYAVWYDYRNGNFEIYFKRSIDGGINWASDFRLTNNNATSDYPSICINGPVIHVVWEDERDLNYEIYYKRSTDGGNSWGTDTRLTTVAGQSNLPSCAVYGQTVHVVWEEYRDGNSEIYYKRSSDGGTSWGADTRLTNNTLFSWNPSVSVSGSNVYVVWTDSRDNNFETYFKRSTDGGLTWGTDTRLSNNIWGSYSPCAAVSGSNIYVAWSDNRDGNYEIYCRISSDGGSTWGAEARLTNASGDSQNPSVAVSNSAVHITWVDYRNGNQEIYYNRSINGGVSWETDTRLTNDPAGSFAPSIALSGSIVHIIWYDNRISRNDEIYYKRNPNGNPFGIKNISSEIPKQFSLSQNYPNPFNPTTKIRFSIPPYASPYGEGGKGDVSLKVFDIIGHEISTLVNEQLKPGTYEVEFDATNYPSGIYFYRLTTDIFTKSCRMVLVK
jgi:hypothetical protein